MIQLVNVIYTAKTHTTGGREHGTSRSSDGRLDVRLSRPGASGDGTNPEQLFAAGWSACFISAMASTIDLRKRRTVSGFSCTQARGAVTLEPATLTFQGRVSPIEW